MFLSLFTSIFLADPMDRGAWQAIVYRVPRGGHNLGTKPANTDAQKKKNKTKPRGKGEKENKR